MPCIVWRLHCNVAITTSYSDGGHAELPREFGQAVRALLGQHFVPIVTSLLASCLENKAEDSYVVTILFASRVYQAYQWFVHRALRVSFCTPFPNDLENHSSHASGHFQCRGTDSQVHLATGLRQEALPVQERFETLVGLQSGRHSNDVCCQERLLRKTPSPCIYAASEHRIPPRGG